MSVSNIHRSIQNICKKDSLPSPSYHWVYQQIKAIPPNLLTLAQKGNKAYKQQFELLFRHDSSSSNAIWQADHTLLDIWVLNEKGDMVKPWLTIVLDDFLELSVAIILLKIRPMLPIPPWHLGKLFGKKIGKVGLSVAFLKNFTPTMVVILSQSIFYRFV